jgi:hypothetical protein
MRINARNWEAHVKVDQGIWFQQFGKASEIQSQWRWF